MLSERFGSIDGNTGTDGVGGDDSDDTFVVIFSMTFVIAGRGRFKFVYNQMMKY